MGQILIKILITQNLLVFGYSAISTQEYRTEYGIPATTPDTPSESMELIKAILAENKNVSVFQDLYGAPDINVQTLCTNAEYSVFRMSHNSTSFIIKQFNGTNAARLVHIEYKALEQRSQIQPGLVPQPYVISEKHNCVVMEGFKEFVSMRSLLTSGELSESAQQNLTRAIAKLHNSSIGDKVSTLGNEFMNNPASEELLKRKYVDSFSNATVSRVNATLNDAALSKLTSAETLEKVKQLYSRITESKQAVIHGNIHDDNVFIHGDNVKLLGNHYTLVGPCSLDVGTALAQYLATYHVHMLTEQDNDAHRQVAYRMIYASTNLVDGYLKEMEGVFSEDQSKEFVSEVAGHAAVELINGVVSGGQQQHAVSAVLDTGLRLLDTHHRIFSAGQLVNIALMLTF